MIEFLIICCVILLIIPPKKWPMVLYHAAQVIRWFNFYKQSMYELCKKLIQEYELEQNQKKANQADVKYKKNNPAS